MARPARIRWTLLSPPPGGRPPAAPRPRRWWRLVAVALAVVAGAAALLALLGRFDLAFAAGRPAGQSATLLPDETWLVLGGRGAAGPLADGWLEDAARGARTPLPGVLLRARAGHSATLLGDGRVLVWGGTGADGAPLAAAELFDPATRASADWPGPMPAPRAGHTATLLPDGRLLLVGGVGRGGAPVTRVEAWDLRRGAVHRWAAELADAPHGHEALLTGTGQVRLGGGHDAAGRPFGGAALDPDAETVAPGSAPAPALPGAAAVSRTWPADGARDVPVDAPLALVVLPGLAPASVTPSAVALAGPDGAVPVDAVAAEGGRLLVVTPRRPLAPAAHHTLTVDGPRDWQGAPLPPLTLGFATAGAAPPARAAAGPAPAAARRAADVLFQPLAWPAGAPEDPQPGEPWAWRGPLRHGRPWSPWQEAPPRRAAPGVTALSGQALDLAGWPLEGVTLRIGDATAATDATGRFLLVAPPDAGGAPRAVVIDGATTAGRPGRAYGRFAVRVALAPGRTTALPYTIWLPALDTAHEQALPPGPLPADVVLTSPRLPGLEVRLPAGSRLRDHAGRAVERVGLTPIPPDRPPFPLPPGVDTPVYFTLQPGGAYVVHPGGAGARLVYPNFADERRAPPGTRCAFWRYDPAGDGWHVYGQGAVDDAGAQVVPDPGTAVYAFTGAMLSVAGQTPPVIAAHPGAQAWAGDPVDLATGLFVLSTTDLYLPGPPYLALTRTYRPEDPAVRAFGRGASHAYALFLWSAQPYQEADLVLPDGARVHYVRTSSGTSFVGAAFAHPGSGTAFDGSTLRWVDGPGGWDLALRDGTVLRFGINAPLQWIRDRQGHTIALHRAGGLPTGPIERISGSNGRWLALTYDAAGRIGQVEDSAGRTVRYAYDADHRLVAVTDPAGGVTRYAYDAGHRMVTLTDARGIAFLANAYDAAGRVVGQTLADGSALGFAYALDAAGRIAEARVTDAAGGVRRVVFDADGYPASDTRAWGTPLARTVLVERDPASRRVVALVDGLGRRTALAYDARGNPTRITALDGTPEAAAWAVAYEPRFALPVTLTDPLGHVTRLAYDARGNLAQLVDPTGRAVMLAHDADGRPVAVTTPAGTTRYRWLGGDLVAVTDPAGQTWTRVVDAVGRPTALADPLGRTTRLAWDALGRLVERVDAAGGRTRFAHDATGNLVAVTDPRGHTTAYAYDAMDRLVARTDPLGGVATARYDGAGRLAEVVDRTGQAVRLTWDALGRLAAATDGDGATTAYEWDAGDRLVRVSDSRSGALVRRYDARDRLVEERGPAGTVQYAHDLAGRRLELGVPGHAAVAYAYDTAGRLVGVGDGSGAVSVALDAAGRPASVARSAGLATDVGWDAQARMTRLAWSFGAAALGDLRMDYDAAGQPIARRGTWAATRLPGPLTAAYDAANRPVAVGGRTPVWDAEGRLAALADPAGVTTYTWNARGQLVGIDGPAGELTFRYDGLGRRSEAIDAAGARTEWLYDGLTPVLERRDGAVRAARLVGPGLDQVWARTAAGGRRWPLADPLGSPVAWVDDAGTVTSRAAYGPFGETDATGEPQPLGFTGREQDLPDLLHFRARAYVPSLQRFISEDPLDEPGTNRYAYAASAPLSGVDPLGLLTIIVHGGAPSLGPNGSSDSGGNAGLNALARFLDATDEPVRVYNAGQLFQALDAARSACIAGQPVHLVGHSLGGGAVMDIAWRLASAGVRVSDLTLIDAFAARFSEPPPGVPALNFFQTQHAPRGGALGGRKVNPLHGQLVSGLGGYAHLTITNDRHVLTATLKMILGHQVPCGVRS